MNIYFNFWEAEYNNINKKPLFSKIILFFMFPLNSGKHHRLASCYFGDPPFLTKEEELKLRKRQLSELVVP